MDYVVNTRLTIRKMDLYIGKQDGMRHLNGEAVRFSNGIQTSDQLASNLF